MRARGLGSGPNGEFTFLDTLGILSFLIGTMNLEENMTQGDKQEILETFSQKADDLLREIHQHLEKQDDKIDKILEEVSNDGRRNF